MGPGSSYVRSTNFLVALILLGCLSPIVARGNPTPDDPSWFRDAPAEDAQPYVAIETFPLPEATDLPADVLRDLESQTGVAGTGVVGLRLAIALPAGYEFESLRAGAADAVFLVNGRSALSTIGHFLARVARLLLFGKLVSVGSSLSVPVEAWAMLFGASPVADESVTVHTEREITCDRDDPGTTDHGSFVVCRLLMAANRFSELIDVRIVGKDAWTGDTVRYRIARLVLPEPQRDSAEISAPLRAKADGVIPLPRFRSAGKIEIVVAR